MSAVFSKTSSFFFALLAVIVAVAFISSPSSDVRQYESFKEIPRIKESELSEESFYKDYVSRGVPLIIVHDDPTHILHPDKNFSQTLKDDLISKCGHKKVDLISATVKTFVQDLNGPFKVVLDVCLRLLLSVDLETWMSERMSRRLADLSVIGKNSDEPLPLSSLVTMFFPRALERILTLGSRGPYLADVKPELVCREVLSKPRPDGSYPRIRTFHVSDLNYASMSEPQYDFMAATKFERFVADLVKDSKSSPQKLGDWPTFSELVYDDADKFFWGGVGTASYPIHRDVNDADAVFTVFGGCKDFIMVHQDERNLLTRLDIPGFNIWYEDLYELGMPAGAKRAYRGTVGAGETIFMPGEMLHEVRNSCPDTIATCRRPWRASAIRNITHQSKEMYRESSYEEIVGRNSFYYALDVILSIPERIDDMIMPKKKRRGRERKKSGLGLVNQ